MSEPIPPGARASPATARNREPILAVVGPRLRPGDQVLEIASGAGEHAVFLAAALPQVSGTPSDPDPEARTSIAAWRDAANLANLAAPLGLDAADPATWPQGPYDAIVCINMIHISPWAATEGLIAGAARVLSRDGELILYGPYLEADVATAPSNLAFDQSLKARNAGWGLRDLAAVDAEAKRHGLVRVERVAMPANNLIVVFARR
jgi:SAM-dependent methyltransferase